MSLTRGPSTISMQDGFAVVVVSVACEVVEDTTVEEVAVVETN
jgi:hypothetical protein